MEPSIDFYNLEGQRRCINCGAQTAISASPSAKFDTTWSQDILAVSVEKARSPHQA